MNQAPLSLASTGAGPVAVGHSSRTLLAFLGYLAFLVAGVVILNALALEPVPTGAFLLTVTLLAVCLFPLAVWQAGPRRGAPMFELICLAFAAAYVLPVFLVPNGIKNFNQYSYLDWGMMTQALAYCLLGVTSMVSGYFIIAGLPLSRWLPRIDQPFQPMQAERFCWFAFGAAGGLRVVDRLVSGALSRGIPAAVSSFLTLSLVVGIALLAYRVYRVDATARLGSKALLFGVITATTILGMGGGMLETVFLPLVVFFVVRWHAGRQFPVAWLFGGCLAFLILNSAKYEYRNEVWFASKEYSLVEQLDAWTRTSSAVARSFTSTDGIELVIDRSVSRLDLIHTLAHVVDLTPSQIPHYGGVSYEYLLYGWVPRIIWPDKPTAQGANILFALEYGLLLDSQTDSTMVGIGFLAEAYANFGIPGVVVVMFLIGCAFGCTHAMFNSPDSDGGRAIYIAVLAYYLNGLGSATSMFVFFGIQGFIVLPLILRFFTGHSRAR